MTNQETNRITSSGNAVINGKFTGLAGCANHCERAASCLRADPRLHVLFVQSRKIGESCQFFITNR